MPVIIRKPAMNLRAELTRAQAKQPYVEQPFYFDADGVDAAFPLPPGWCPVRVFQDEARKREGDSEAYTIGFDGFVYSVVFAVTPAEFSKIDIDAVKL